MGEGRARVDDFVATHALAWEIALATLTLVYVVVGFVDDRSAIEVVSVVTIALSLTFLAEFSVRCWASTSRVGYLRGHWLDLVTCIPAVGPLRLFRMLRLIGIIRFARSTRSTLLIRAKRNNGEALLGEWLVAPTLVLLWLGSSAGFWLLERGVNPHVTNFSDALFLSFITATTVGNSSMQPVTVEGQVLSGLVIFIGLGLLGFVSARLTAMWLKQGNDSGQVAVDLKSLRHELSEIRDLLANLADLIEPHQMGPAGEIRVESPVPSRVSPSSPAESPAKAMEPTHA
jgi:voltage-gated potassium channel